MSGAITARASIGTDISVWFLNRAFETYVIYIHKKKVYIFYMFVNFMYMINDICYWKPVWHTNQMEVFGSTI